MDNQSLNSNKKIYIANWKSNKTPNEASQFFDYIKENISEIDLSEKELIIAPPFTLLAMSKELIDTNNLPIKLAAQNVSAFPPGAYTGEINAKQIKEFADYVIIGHSERRKYMHESEMDLENKIREATENSLIVVQCVQNEESVLHKGAEIIAYEPPTAIGSGNPDDPSHISEVFQIIKSKNPQVRVLYGGSVNPDNIQTFTSIENLSGFLVGGASLEAQSFLSLL